MDPLSISITTLAGVASAWLLQKSKKHITAWDSKAGEWIKPAQPAIVVGMSMLAPWLVSHTGVDIGDPSQLVNAPVSGIIGVVVANYAKKLSK